MLIKEKAPDKYNTKIKPLDTLIKTEGIVEYIRDYCAAVNNRLSIIYETEDFYIAEDNTFQPWLSVMGNLPHNMTEQELHNLLLPYIKNEKYIAVYTNIEQVSKLFSMVDILTYHEDFIIGLVPETSGIDKNGIRLATINDLPYIEKTYIRSGHEQLLNRINQKQMWVLDDGKGIKAYAGIHKDGSLGFEYVAPNSRRQNLASRMQSFIANQMIKNNMIPYVMISKDNEIAKKLQTKQGSVFAEKLFYFYAKGKYELE